MKVVAKTKDVVKLKSYYCCLIFIYSPVNGCDQTSKPSSPAGPSHGLPGVESSCSNTSEIAFLHGTAISGVQLFLRSCFFRTYWSMKVSSTNQGEVDFWWRSEEQSTAKYQETKTSDIYSSGRHSLDCNMGACKCIYFSDLSLECFGRSFCADRGLKLFGDKDEYKPSPSRYGFSPWFFLSMPSIWCSLWSK